MLKGQRVIFPVGLGVYPILQLPFLRALSRRYGLILILMSTA